MTTPPQTAPQVRRGGTHDAIAPRRLAIALLVVIALACAPTLGFGFVYDDQWVLVANGFLRRPAHWLDLWNGRALSRGVPDAFRPTSASFDVLAHALFGLGARSHHALSIALHVACAWVAYVLARTRLGAPEPVAVGGLAIFGLMAIHAEPIAVISFREDLLAVALALAAVAVAWPATRARAVDTSLDAADDGGARPHPAVARWLCAAGLAALAAGAKESVWTLPLGVVAMARLSPWRGALPWPRTIAIASSSAVGVAVIVVHRIVLLGAASPYPAAITPAQSPVDRASTAIIVAAQTLVQTVLGVGNAPEHDASALAGEHGPALMCAVGIGVALGYAAWGAMSGRRRGAALLVALMVLAWLPVSGLIPLPNARADRYAYLLSIPVAFAMASVSLGAAQALAERWEVPGRWIGGLTAPLAIALAHAVGFVATQRTYESDARLWQTAGLAAPGAARPHALIGLGLLARAGHRVRDEAWVAAEVAGRCRIAEARAPKDDLPQICWSRLAAALGDWDSAADRAYSALTHARGRRDRLLGDWLELEARRTDDADPVARQARLGARWAEASVARWAFPYSADLASSTARFAHVLGHPEVAAAELRRARSLQPERWQNIVWGVELALDRGDAPSALHTWGVDQAFIRAADPLATDLLRRRLLEYERHHELSRVDAFFALGAFPDESP